MKDKKYMTELSQKDERPIRRYLLGQLTERERLPIEERLLRDDAFYEHLQLIEGELIDEYVRGGLSGRERRHFEEHFLNTAERRRQVQFAAALRRYARDKQVTPLVVEKRPSPLAAFWRAAMSYKGAFAAAALVLVAVFSYVLIRQTRVSENTLVPSSEAPATAAAPSTPGERLANEETPQTADANQPPDAGENPAAPGAPRQSVRQTPAPPAPRLALVLSPIRTRDSASTPTLQFRPNERAVNIRLDLPDDGYNLYNVTLNGPQVERALGRRRAKAENDTKFIILTLPAAELNEGDYVLRLTPAGSGAAGAPPVTYYFRLLAP